MTRSFLFALLLLPLLASAQPELSVELVFDFDGTVTAIEENPTGAPLQLVALKNGFIRYFPTGGIIVGPPFLDISNKVSTNSERGLLGLAFHPDFANKPYCYVNYTNPNGTTTIARFTVVQGGSGAIEADPASELILMTIPQPFANHNGGDLNFGPDGYLYIAVGDGGSGGDPEENGQDRSNPLGALLRIDVDGGGMIGGPPYGIPADNPFVGMPNMDDRIWAYGLRNPWRFSFDAQTGDLWIADVGQNLFEEIDFEPAGDPGGRNYGWDCYEGNAQFEPTGCDTDQDGYTFPVLVMNHSGSAPALSITGGFVYRGSRLDFLPGWYVSIDYVTNRFFLVKRQDDGSFETITQDASGMVSGVTSFGEIGGELYLGNAQGQIYRLDDQTLTSVDEPGASGSTGLIVRPNPARGGELFFSLLDSSSVPIDAEIVDLTGRRLVQTKVAPLAPAGGYRLVTADLPAGVYVLRVSVAGKWLHRKVVVGR